MQSWRSGVAALVCLLLGSLSAVATPIGLAAGSLPPIPVGSLPACTTALQGTERWVTGLASTSSCSGTGAAKTACLCTPSGWQPRGAGGGSSNSFATMTPTSGTSPVASSPTDTLNVSAGTGITVTGNSGTKTLTIGLGTGIDPLNLSPGTVTSTELGYVHGVTSAIQTQLAAKLPLAGGTVTGNITMSGATVTGIPTAVNPGDAVPMSQLLDGTTVIHKDGSVAFGASQSFGGFQAHSLADGVVKDDAANLRQVHGASAAGGSNGDIGCQTIGYSTTPATYGPYTIYGRLVRFDMLGSPGTADLQVTGTTDYGGGLVTTSCDLVGGTTGCANFTGEAGLVGFVAPAPKSVSVTVVNVIAAGTFSLCAW